MKKLKVGLVGTGFWSMYHLKAWSEAENAELYALCNRSEKKLAAKADEYNIPQERRFTDYAAMLASDIDIVDVVTGPESHVELVTKALKAKKPVLCQKPFANSMEDVKTMVDMAAAEGVPLMVTENWRFNAPFLVAKKVLDEGILGDIMGVRYYHANNFSLNMNDKEKMLQPYFLDMKRLLFFEHGTHFYDTVFALFGLPKKVTAVYNRISPYVIGDDNGVAVLGYEAFNVIIDGSWATRRGFAPCANESSQNIQDESMYIDGTKGSLLMEKMGNGRPDKAVITFVDKDGNRKVLSDDTQYNRWDSIKIVTDNFANAVLGKEKFATDGKYCETLMDVMFKAYESSEQGRTIEI